MIFDFWFFWMLAQAGAVEMDVVVKILGWVTTFVVMVIGAVLTPFLKNKWKDEAKQEVTVGPQPFQVSMAEDFVTRREFEKHEAKVDGALCEIKGMITGSSAEMKGLFHQTMSEMKAQTASINNRMDRREKLLSAKIDAMGTGAYQGRKAIWGQINESREELAGLKATSDVAKQIGKLAEAIQPTLCDKEEKKKS